MSETPGGYERLQEVSMMEEMYQKAMNRVVKWAGFFTRWQLSKYTKDDPQVRALEKINQARIVARIEMNAIVKLMLLKGVITQDEFYQQMIEEAADFDRGMMQEYRGFHVTDTGVSAHEGFDETAQRIGFK